MTSGATKVNMCSHKSNDADGNGRSNTQGTRPRGGGRAYEQSSGKNANEPCRGQDAGTGNNTSCNNHGLMCMDLTTMTPQPVGGLSMSVHGKAMPHATIMVSILTASKDMHTKCRHTALWAARSKQCECSQRDDNRFDNPRHHHYLIIDTVPITPYG